MGPRWALQGGRGNLDLAPDPQIGGPGPRTKGRGQKGLKGSGRVAPSEEGGGVWLERTVIYGVTVARGQTHPGRPTRYMAFWPSGHFGHSICGVLACSLLDMHTLPVCLHTTVSAAHQQQHQSEQISHLCTGGII